MQTSPSLGTRLSIAARAFAGIFSDDSARQAHGMLGGIFSGSAGDPPYRGTANILAAYSTMPWLRAVAQRVATSVAASTTQWRLYAPTSGQRRDVRMVQRSADAKSRRAMLRKNNEITEVESHILLDALNSANSYMVGQSLFKLTQLHLDLVGESFWIKERNAFGAPVEFWPVPPDWVQATPTPSSRSYEVSFGAWQGPIPETEILWMADLDPSNPYGRGSGMARSLSDELETDEYAAKHTRQLFFNRARPDMIIWPKQQGAHDIGLQQDQVRRLEERWLDGHQGFWRAFKPFFVGREIAVHEVNQSLQELQLVELRKHERDTIVQVFGIPPELLGILNNSNRATIESADYLFSRWVVAPRLEFLRSQLQERLIPDYDDRLVLDFVSPVEEDRAHMLEAAKAAPWAMKVDEWRTLQGQETLDDETGQVHMMPMNLMPVRTPSVPPAPVPATVAGETPPEGDVIADGWDDHLAVLKEAGDTDAVTLVQRELADETSDLPVVWQELARQEPAVARMIRRHIFDLSDRVSADQLADVTTGVQVEELVRLDEWLVEMESLMTPRWLRAWWTGAENSADELDIPIERSSRRTTKQDPPPLPQIAPIDIPVQLPDGGYTFAWDFNALNPAAINWAKIHAAQFVQQIGDDTRAAIRQSVTDATTLGLGVQVEARELLKLQIGLTKQQRTSIWHYRQRLMATKPHLTAAQRIADIKRYRDSKVKLRAMTIARTELAFAQAGGREEIWLEGVKQGLLDPTALRRKWTATFDGRTCPICKALGKLAPIPFDKSFSYGKFIGNTTPAHPNCRCTVSLVRAKKPKV
jgi:HK97 family phage portal protein